MVLCLGCDALRFELAQGGKTRKRVDVAAGDVLLPACGHQSAREYARSLPAGGIQYRNTVDEPGVVPRAPNFPLFASSISHLQNRGVQVEFERSVAHRQETIGRLTECAAPAARTASASGESEMA